MQNRRAPLPLGEIPRELLSCSIILNTQSVLLVRTKYWKSHPPALLFPDNANSPFLSPQTVIVNQFLGCVIRNKKGFSEYSSSQVVSRVNPRFMTTTANLGFGLTFGISCGRNKFSRNNKLSRISRPMPFRPTLLPVDIIQVWNWYRKQELKPVAGWSIRAVCRCKTNLLARLFNNAAGSRFTIHNSNRTWSAHHLGFGSDKYEGGLGHWRTRS